MVIKSEDIQPYKKVYEVEVRADNEIGSVTLQIHGPNSKQNWSIGINKAKTSDIKFVKLISETFIKRLLHDNMTGEGCNYLKSGKGIECFD